MTPLIIAPDVLIWIGLKPGKNRSVDPGAGRWDVGLPSARAGGASVAPAEPSSIASDWCRKSRRRTSPSASVVRFVLMTTPCWDDWASDTAPPTDRAQAAGDSPASAREVDDSPCLPGHNTPFPLEITARQLQAQVRRRGQSQWLA